MSSVSGSGERILALLNLFSETRPAWQPDDMMATLGYSRPTFYRYLKTLKDAGYLASLPSVGITLGPKVTELDFLMRRSDPLIDAGQPHLEALAAQFKCSAFLVRWYDRKLLCVASEVSAEAPLSSYPRGRPMPLGRGAISRAIVAFLQPKDRRRLVTEYLSEFAVAGLGTTAEMVLAELKSVRRRGVAVAYGEVTPGVVGVAAPILAGENAPIGALCLTSNARDVSGTQLDQIRTAVLAVATNLSCDLQSAEVAKPETV